MQKEVSIFNSYRLQEINEWLAISTTVERTPIESDLSYFLTKLDVTNIPAQCIVLKFFFAGKRAATSICLFPLIYSRLWCNVRIINFSFYGKMPRLICNRINIKIRSLSANFKFLRKNLRKHKCNETRILVKDLNNKVNNCENEKNPIFPWKLRYPSS